MIEDDCYLLNMAFTLYDTNQKYESAIISDSKSIRRHKNHHILFRPEQIHWFHYLSKENKFPIFHHFHKVA